MIFHDLALYSQIYAMYIACTDTYIHYWMHYFSKNRDVCTYMLVYVLVQTMHITRICLLCTISQWKSNSQKLPRIGFEPKTMCMPERRLIHWPASIVVRGSIVTVYDNCFKFTWRLMTYVRSRTSCTPAPAMTLQARASTWISVKLRSAAKQALEALMWRHTPATSQPVRVSDSDVGPSQASSWLRSMRVQ